MADEPTQRPSTAHRRTGTRSGAGAPICRIPIGSPVARQSIGAAVAGILILAAPATASDWRFEAFGNAQVTVTDNANLAPSGQADGDVILVLTPGLRARREGGRLSMSLSYAPSAVVGGTSNRWVNTLAATGSLEAVEDFFFIDANASISQQFLSPFGPTPTDLAIASGNRTNVTTLGVSPYIRGQFGATGITYLVRNNSNWTNASGAGGSTGYYNNTVARLNGAPATVAWGLEADRRNQSYRGQSDFVNQNYRARLTWTIDPQLRVFATGGYQTNNYSATQRSGAIYGGGFDWRPSERASVAASYEEQFYGPSWLVNASYRTPLSFWSLVGARQLSSYPQQALLLPPGDTATTLNSVLVSRFPDPVARQAEVQRLIQTLGLPAFLIGPQAFYTQSVFVNERVTLSAGLIGTRNTVTFVAFTGYSETIPATSDVAVQGAFASATKIDQRGVAGNWSHRLTPLTSLNFNVSRTQSLARQPTGSESTTDQFWLSLARPFGPKTNGSLGFRYTIFDSNVGNDYRAASVIAAVNHTF